MSFLARACDLDPIEADRLRAIDRERRLAHRSGFCSECHQCGGHARGCPEAPEEEEQPAEETQP